MRSNVRLAIAALLATASVVACGTGTASTAPQSSSQNAASQPPSQVAPPSSPAASSSHPAPTVALVVPHDDPALEATLPDEAEGVTLFKLSVGIVSSISTQGAAAMRDLAKKIGDGTGNFGLAYAGDNTNQKFNLFALRIPGASADDLLTNYSQLTLADTPGGTIESVTLGGRSLVHITQPGSVIGDVWFYVKTDTIYGVQTGSPAAATKLLALLP